VALRLRTERKKWARSPMPRRKERKNRKGDGQETLGGGVETGRQRTGMKKAVFSLPAKGDTLRDRVEGDCNEREDETAASPKNRKAIPGGGKESKGAGKGACTLQFFGCQRESGLLLKASSLDKRE